MFTLAALVGRATSPPPAMPPTPQQQQQARQASVAPAAQKREGSGVIDLNALARAAEERARRAQSEPPMSAFAREARADAPPPPSRKLRFIGIAAAAGMLAVVGLIVAVSGGDEPKAQARAAAAQVAAPKAEAPAPPPVVTPPPAATQDPAPAASPVAQASSPAKSAGGGGKWHASAAHGKGAKIASGPKVNMSKVTSGGLSAKSDAAPAPKAKPTPAADPCNCKGNLQCAIKCFK
jgi:hypothetical protein